MSDAFKCDRCGTLFGGEGNRHTEYKTIDGQRDRINRDFCDGCNRIIKRVMTGELQVQDFNYDEGQRP